ncbi:hypothetical protein FQA47_024755 [Oryzias melastigma]|uniref:Uncharacterized protein n=1 Tax=Oryzias melastigma TaxID=30732 RepID=A0A834C834_ORYME|nr:hypothetical protein FQA47_024755 [Oryzias melastigma]
MLAGLDWLPPRLPETPDSSLYPPGGWSVEPKWPEESGPWLPLLAASRAKMAFGGGFAPGVVSH